MECPAQAILGVVEKVLVRMEQASHLGHSENGDLRYYHEDRTHQSFPRLGGLHHRYAVAA